MPQLFARPLMNAFERIEILCNQWERTAPPLPTDARHLLTKLAKEIVLDCAAQCDNRGRPADKNIAIRQEAKKCADQIRWAMLCKDGESVCLHCDGKGCQTCEQTGIRRARALWHGSGCYIPASVAVCPECRGELYAKSMSWDKTTGRPIGSALEINCVQDPDLNHRWHQSDWQPVIDSIRKWCGATAE